MAEPRSSKPLTRVRFPPPAPTSLRLVARIPAFQAGEDGSKPSGRTNLAGSFNGRTVAFEAAYEGSSPSPASSHPLGLAGEERGLMSSAGWIVTSTSDHLAVQRLRHPTLAPDLAIVLDIATLGRT